MHYTIHGVHGASGSNVKIGTARTLRRALIIARTQIDSNVCPLFAIVERVGANQIALAVHTGATNDGTLTRSAMLVHPLPNPLQEPEAGAAFWAGSAKDGRSQWSDFYTASLESDAATRRKNAEAR